MAKLIASKFDLFKSDGEADVVGDNGQVYAGGEIRVPHYLGAIFAKMAYNAKQAGGPIPKIELIKFMREWHLDLTGKLLGLKDAKDIVEHYIEYKNVERDSWPSSLR